MVEFGRIPTETRYLVTSHIFAAMAYCRNWQTQIGGPVMLENQADDMGLSERAPENPVGNHH